MELRHLRYFVAVAEERGFVHAAERLRVAQSALSKQIRDLEHEVGQTLFRRLPRGAELTPAGEAFLLEARVTLDAAGRALERARGVAPQAAPSVRVGHGELYDYAAPVARLLAAFREAQPTVPLSVMSQTNAETAVALRERRIDVGCVFITQPRIEGFQSHLLPDTSATGVLLRKGHPLASTAALHVSALRGHHWLGPTKGPWPGVTRTLEDALRDRGLVPLRAPERPAASPFISLIAGDAWALVSEVVGASYGTASTEIVYRPILDPSIPAWLALVWLPRASRAIQALVRVARALGFSADNGHTPGVRKVASTRSPLLVEDVVDDAELITRELRSE
jgi:DNA-binding transcriptional LysR family regulator